ncbi:leucine-rich repeat domain-containing protein [Clostridium estertheticum]|uniref:leucine-rich repeat domain-containing protein n=1 Tax=Clostridium estertheticum TaxID=238834 RepID=UPI001C7D2EF6|nr:leucine-rich repeat domain-containing protein [Clostridium estertheticum]MBX4261561.1 leucine-rich repeat domain-containing protein [Clostridium estertheticum]WLC70939.1 leucine-rich repeat domain-containing protein [Clostridium estertheticum]
MKKKITSSFIIALMIAGITSSSAFATTANGSVVIGDKTFDLAYANDVTNSTEITNAIIEGGAIYVKDFSGNWIDNITGKIVNESVIPGENGNQVVIATVRANTFGATVNATSTQEGATQYQIFNGTTKISEITNLGTNTVIFPSKTVGDTVIIKLFNVSGVIVATTNVTLVAPIEISPIIKVTNISLNKTTDSLTVDGTDNLIATINPTDATNKAVNWTSSANNIATVDNNGKVTAVSKGTTTITATTKDGINTANCIVTVNGIVAVNSIVTFKDKKLEKVVRATINKPTGTLHKSDVVKITKLPCEGEGISDISGIENLENLQNLDLYANSISDISALKGLINLKELFLSMSKISDISPLEGLTNLQILWLDGNKISDISSLKGLTNLQELNLASNQISDMSPLKELTNLGNIGLDANKISDISVLKGLTNLQKLKLGVNQISDITPLEGLTKLQVISLEFNQIRDISSLGKLSNLQQINLNANQISDISVLKGLVNLQELYLDSNQISDENMQSLQGELPNCSVY